MDDSAFLDKMREIQINFLEYLDSEEHINEQLHIFTTYLDNQNIQDNKHELKLFLKMVLKIASNHHRSLGFFEKIENVLQYFKKEISEYYSNRELINIFIDNKRIFLFSIEEKLITVDEYFVKKITTDKYVKAKYPQYFSLEIKRFMKEPWFPKNDAEWIKEIEKEIPENFDINRDQGENESQICQMIRNDSIEEFDAFITKCNYSLESPITASIYETNSFLIKNQNDKFTESLTLIEYAAFFGSIQIFQYLRLKGVELKPSLWLYAIHSNNAELIHLLEENHIEFEDESSMKYVKEAIKCHEIDITNYIQENYVENTEENQIEIIIQFIKCFNFISMKKEFINQTYFYYFCRYGYYFFSEILFNQGIDNINHILISKTIFEYNSDRII